MFFCTVCGARLEAEARFCAECGTALTNLTSRPAPEPYIAQAGTRPPVPAASRRLDTTRFTIRLSQLTPAQTAATSKDGLRALAAAGGVLLVTVALAAGIFAPEGHRGSPADWLRTTAIILGLGVHAPAELHIAVTGGLGVAANASVVAAATFTPLIVTGLIGFCCFWFARRTERKVSSENIKVAATASLLTGAVFAGAATLLALLGSGSPGFGLTDTLPLDGSTTASLGANPWYLLLAAFALAAACTFLGRMATLARAPGVTLNDLVPARVVPWLTDLRAAKNLMLGAAAVTVFGLACFLGWSGIQALFASDPVSAASSSAAQIPGPGAKEVIGVILAIALLLPNLVVAGVGFALGGTLGLSVSGGASSSLLGSDSWVRDLGKGIGLLNGGVPATAYLILLPMLLMALALGVRSAVQRAPDEAYGPHVWRTTALFAGAWVLPALLVRISVSITGNAAALSESGETFGSATAGLGLFSILIVALLWGTTTALGGALIARFVAAALPRPISLLGGSDLDPEWRLLLAAAVLARGGKIPDRLAAAAEEVCDGVRPQSLPLDVRPKRDRRLAIGAASLVTLVVAGTIGYGVVQDNVYGPEATVREYFSAVAARNVPAALDLLDASTSNGLDKSLLTSAAMRKVPSNVSVGTVTVTGDQATVTVNQTLDGTATQATFTLTREGSAGVIFDAWRLKSPFTQLTISTNNVAASSSLTVNGVVAAGTHPVFPGVYTVAQPKSGVYQATDTRVSSTGEGSGTATLNGKLDPRVQKAADQAVRKLLDACAKSVDAAPAGCGFSYDVSTNYGDAVTDVRWSIISYPTVSVDDNPDGTISLTTDAEGMAHVTAVSTDWAGNVTPVNQEPRITFSGTLNWEGGDPSTAYISTD